MQAQYWRGFYSRQRYGNNTTERAKLTTFKPPRTKRYFDWILRSIPSIEFFIKVVVTSRIGSRIGSARMAIKVRLFPAFDAMVERRLNMIAIPKAPRTTVVKKMVGS